MTANAVLHFIEENIVVIVDIVQRLHVLLLYTVQPMSDGGSTHKK